ncbi:Na+/H+ antiporter subunit D [Paenibacillus eucommiae]|uniref:Multicomponent Na+:H+ antiporter subunit D n=1 Tax=Paenibacillus eucommiae TaxID=1355755 RepID=A0ABS4J8Z8_9BACL|nr:Na+/H+ antiporter subunit D [Paenibacillus eucommiae]MBP1996318.1 multicomponent Na+:H+ antiporter subunit D [Paenibacillus eucommiae]
MNNMVVLPLLIPLFTAVMLIFFHKRLTIQRWISGVSSLASVFVSVWIVLEVREEGIQTLHMGGWLPPYGIVFVADMFASLLVLTTSVVSAACLFYAFRSIGADRERNHFYSFVHFLIAGVMGSFLTGDLFNLFVCFEVMLIASYALIVLGGTRRQLRETLKYILINIVSSTLFVAAVAYLYAAAGTLNMAHLSVRVAEAGQGGIMTVIAVLFLIVFSLKAGLFLFFWLPGSYGAPPAVVAALYGALLTKVGLYAIIRMFTLVFYHEPGFTHTIIGWMAAATMILGGIGAIAYKDVSRILSYNVIAGVGFIAFGLAAANRTALEGVIYYLMHDMLIKALLFLLGGIIVALAGTDKLQQMGGLITRNPLLGWMFFISALAMVGVPPLSGFIGKLLIVQGGLESGFYWTTGISLALSLLLLTSMLNIFMNAFWGEEKMAGDGIWKSPRLLLVVSAALLILVIFLGVGAEWVDPYVSQAADVLLDAQLYIDAVLKE